MDVVLGLDLGTTNCKALAVDADGQPVASLSAPTPSQRGALGQEYDADELWLVCAHLIRQLLERLGPNRPIRGLAVASMGESGVLLDQDGRPVAPGIIWHDPRTVPWVTWWRERISETELYRITGLQLRHIYSANHLLWYREHRPTQYAQARTWLCLADWITFRLTRRLTTSYSLACRTMLFDVRARDWSDDLLRLAGVAPDLLPRPLPSGTIAGSVTPDAARETGLFAGTPVAVGGHDHICAALAAGVVEPGRVLDSSGTVEAMLTALDAPALDYATSNGMSCGCHTARERYYLIGGLMSGAIVDWLARQFARDDSPAALNEIMELASRAPRGANGLWFEPYLDGVGPRPLDPDAWGGWLGLRINHTRADMIRAAMEGLTFGLRQLLQGLEGAAGSTAAELCAVGGGSRNRWWQSLKADILGVPIKTLALSDVTGQGAALLAGIGAGLFVDEADAIARAHRPGERYPVNAENRDWYDAAYRDVFAKLYPALKAIPLPRPHSASG